MERKKLKLTQVALNEHNPRTITETKLQKLIDSILVFPRMLELRPIVIDETMTALGGNMRLKALTQISGMTAEQITERLQKQGVFGKKTAGEQEAITQHWTKWLKAPSVTAVMEQELTEDEKKQFIIKDNVSFGDWDYDELENWDTARLEDWGVDTQLPDFGSAENAGGGNLPSELEGQDLLPDTLEKIEGEDRTAMQRVIICYYEKDIEKMKQLLGVEEIEKVVYRLDELVK